MSNSDVKTLGYIPCVTEGVTDSASYVRANPEHEVHVCKNVQHGGSDELRVSFLLRQGPYRPRTLGIYVVGSFEEALEKLAARTRDDDTNINEKGNPLNGR